MTTTTETPAIHTTREAWLCAALDLFRPWFEALGHHYPERLRISCGLAGTRIGTGRIGECWSPEASADEAREVFISPELDDPVRVLDVTLHEVCHAVLPHEVGHGTPFRKLATALGLEGRMTATVAGPELTARLNAMVEELGPYPHAAMSMSARKKQGTRMLKIVCPDCGYTLRGTKKWVEVGLPSCCCGANMRLKEGDEGEGEGE